MKKYIVSLLPKIEIALLEAISKTGFWFKISRRRSAGQERWAEVQPEGMLKYSEELKRGSNTEIGPKDFF